ncbi:hypothetical protein D6745_04670 [Candidatus Woesearchaeota archaeon]|nr:MAG: hypothetical protein D6745_04670 [Candidatus Woesearchaeota archaeon]
MKTKTLIISLFFVLLIPVAHARSGHVKLLAVSETGEGELVGSVADIYLQIKPGTGRIFFDTFPLTKIDTQVSTRFAKDIACNFLDVDCDEFNFFYTIKSNSAIVGGPSAGAAITILTMAVLEGVEINESVTITGTINSGNIIGPVGGTVEKIRAAAKEGIKTVLISEGKRFVEENNKTVDLVELGKNLSINVVEVGSLNDAFYYFTGIKLKEEDDSFTISKAYQRIMRNISIELCGRSSRLKGKAENLSLRNSTEFEEAENLTKKGIWAFINDSYYSSASYCFGANIKYRNILLKNISVDELVDKRLEIKDEIIDFEKNVSSVEIKTIQDLQTMMVVKERIADAKERIDNVLTKIVENNTEAAVFDLAYGIERLYSAQTWSKFFGGEGKAYDLSAPSIEDSCYRKLSEADERYQYAKLFIPFSLDHIKEELVNSLGYSMEGDYVTCLAKSIEAKAKSDIILTTLTVEESQLQNMISKKLKTAGKNIAKAEKEGIFPILGFSYYEYAKSLQEEDPLSALLYSEYAIELSNLDIYFKSKKKSISLGEKTTFSNEFIEKCLYFVAGVGIGSIIVMMIANCKKPFRRRRRKRRKLFILTVFL